LRWQRDCGNSRKGSRARERGSEGCRGRRGDRWNVSSPSARCVRHALRSMQPAATTHPSRRRVDRGSARSLRRALQLSRFSGVLVVHFNYSSSRSMSSQEQNTWDACAHHVVFWPMDAILRAALIRQPRSPQAMPHHCLTWSVILLTLSSISSTVLLASSQTTSSR
jgi:hypothetical protein